VCSTCVDLQWDENDRLVLELHKLDGRSLELEMELRLWLVDEAFVGFLGRSLVVELEKDADEFGTIEDEVVKVDDDNRFEKEEEDLGRRPEVKIDRL
jgi:hypothetical protein